MTRNIYGWGYGLVRTGVRLVAGEKRVLAEPAEALLWKHGHSLGIWWQHGRCSMFHRSARERVRFRG